MSDQTRDSQPVPPASFASTPPPIDMGLDRLEAMNSMMMINQKLGSLQTAVEFINRDIRDLRDRDIADLKKSIGEQTTKISGIDKKVYAAIAVLGIIGFIGGPIATFLLQRWLGH